MLPERLALLDEPYVQTATDRLELPCNVPGFLIARLAIDEGWHSREALLAVF